MIDQATELRKLVLRAMRGRAVTTGPPPRLMVVTGGRAGAGVTTIAVNLAVTLAEQGSRVVIVDADPHRSDVASLCRLNDGERGATFGETPRDIHEVLLPGPAGIQIVPGSWMFCASAPRSHQHRVNEISHERFHRQLLTLGRHADVVLLDLGCESSDLLRRLSATADDVLLVTAPDNVAVMDTYTRIKADLANAGKDSLRLVVNFAADALPAADVHRRIDASCRKFLNATIGFAGHVPQDAAVPRGAIARIPFVLGERMSLASQALDKLASELVPNLSQVRSA